MNPSVNNIHYLEAFLGGVGVSLTPCVLPLVPVVIGYIGVKAETARLKGFALSLIYVTGIAIIYAFLGLFASLTGKFFGTISSYPITYIFVGLVIIIFGLSMFDLFHIPLPPLIKSPRLKEKNFLSVFLLGLSSGLVIGPCTTPVLGAILAIVVTKKNILYGATLLLCFAYGMGLVLLLAGTFSSALLSLSKPGKWMLYIKKLGGIILLGMGIYFISIAIRMM